MADLTTIPTRELLKELQRRFDHLEATQPREKYTLKDLALGLGVSKFTLQRWCREGMPTGNGKEQINYAKECREYVFTGDEVLRIKRLRSS